LAFAAPLSRKDKPGVPSSSTTTPVPERPAAPTPKAAAAPPPKPKKKGTDPVPTPAPAAEVPRISIKGKEREVASVQPTPSKPRPAASGTPVSEKKCRDVLRAIAKLPEYSIFGKPVDPVRDGCPTYYEEIAHPMDFGTMGQKLTEGKYVSMEEFAKDADLVFNNCSKFNPPTTYPVTCADLVEKAFKKEWGKVFERKLSWAEKRSLQGLMTTLVKEDISFVFREPVDPVLLGIPTYFQVISKKDTRDLRTIRTKLDNDKYDSIETFEADMDLMIRNAITFNGADSEVGKISYVVQDRYKDMLNNIKSGGGTKKRKEGDAKPTPQPAKKAKLG